jgi:Flp pilus assembly pilin Flp
MHSQWKRWLLLANDQRGGALVEYVIVVALVAAVAVGAWQVFGEDVKEHIEASGTTINNAIGEGGE